MKWNELINEIGKTKNGIKVIVKNMCFRYHVHKISGNFYAKDAGKIGGWANNALDINSHTFIVRKAIYDTIVILSKLKYFQ